MENSIEEDIKIIEDFLLKTDVDYLEYNEQIVGDISYQAIQHLLSAYQEVLKENEILKKEKEQAWEEWNNLEQGSYETEQKLKQQIKESQRENEELKQDYYNLINKIENKIDRFDYEFEKAKKQNNKDRSDYYWDLIINFKKLIESEE